ncbi:iqgap- protein [Coemansia sp. RSA 2049]|nr:iqgap- protein [Coemansia sp. RSA 1939]KAJ2524251.1 iqgap- protein [Coemansia sp. RSA 2049]KAJ2618055.1 iqgap- protein [Coemansia sp. RSA 1804]KAJ2695380.1 iqgap- protein [Coemansia sp. RSA 1285]
MDAGRRPRASTLAMDSGNQRGPDATGESDGNSAYMFHEQYKRDVSEGSGNASTNHYNLAVGGSALPASGLRNRSRTVAADASAIPRPLSALMVEAPDSPSVMGLKGRHKLQQREGGALSSDATRLQPQPIGGSGTGTGIGSGTGALQLLMRSKNWCDIERQNLAAYEYLCHVSEAKEWIEACIKEPLPSIESLEDSLRDGVALAKLARTFCPEAVGKIYEDKTAAAAASKEASGGSSAAKLLLTNGVRRRFVFKYTDNINFFLSAIRQVRLPRLFHFELTDLYDRKNMPRVIYCLHALSHFLLRMGIAPEMRDLVGHLEFSEDQLKQTQAELDNLGTNMPSFKNIDSSIGDRRPRLSRQVCPLQPEDWNEDEDEEDDESAEVSPKSVSFSEDVSYLDDPSIDRMEKAKLYWQRRIDIVLQCQTMARQRLAERLLEEKRQARRYMRMVESATTMQCLARAVLAKRQLQTYQDEVAAAERSRQLEEEEQRLEQMLEERARRDRAEREKAEKEQAEKERLEAEKAEKKRVAKEKAEKEQAERERIRKEEDRKMQERLEVERMELERRIVGVQALVRGKLARKVYTEMRGWTDAITRFQALCRGYFVRTEVGDRLSMWGRVEAAVRRIQALSRGYLVRQRIKDRKTHLRRNVNVIVKMQNMYRAKLAGKAYRTLTVEDTPPTPKIVQSCAPLLEDTDQDLEEELELERLRQKAVRQIRENQQTSRILDHLDIKIALLVRNRISLDEVLRQTKRHFRFLDELRRPLAPSGSSSGSGSINIGILRGAYPTMTDSAGSLYSLRNMDKESRRRLEGYQNLFYLLQTQPLYLARLLFLLNQNGSKSLRTAQPSSNSGESAGVDISIAKLIETIVLTLFGFAQNAREEYLLLKLFCAAIQIELSAIDTLPEFLRGNPIFIKLAVHYNRGAKERKYLRDLLQPLIKKVIDDPDLDLESDPLAIYRTLIREEESRTGEKSRRPYDISREDALNDMETRTTFIRHLRQLRVLADEFIAAIQSSLGQMPYGMRYIARELRSALTAKFPDEPEPQVMKIVGHLVYYRYINPAIVAPESFDVIETTISPLQRKNLAEIAKMLNQVSVGKHFNEDNMFLQPLNNYVGYTSAKFLSYSFEVTEVVDPEVYFQVDEFTDLATLNKPSVLMSVGEIQAIHQALEANLDKIAPPIPEQIKQRFGSYEAVIGIIERRRRQEEERATGVSGGTGGDPSASAASIAGGGGSEDDDDDTDLADAIPQGTVLVERPAADGASSASAGGGRVLVLEDPLRVILQDLGAAPRTRVDPYSRHEIQLDLADRFADDAITIMSGSAATSVLAASASQILSDAAISASQASYGGGGLLRHQPTAKEAVHAKAERAAKLHRLFLETKRKWLSILRVQSGASLLEILERPVAAADESRWRATIQLELAKLEDRRQKHAAQWQRQWEAQQQAALLRESQEAISFGVPGRSSPAPSKKQSQQQLSQKCPPPPALPGEKVVRELALMTFSELKRQVAKAMRVLEAERWVERTRKSNIGTGNNLSSKQASQQASQQQQQPAVRPAYASVFRVRRSDGYQGMLNAVARDIRTKAQRRERRRAEMRRIRITLLNLREKSDYLESQRQSYEQYLDSCTKKLAAGGDSSVGAAQARQVRRMHSVLPFTRQYFHLRDLQRSGRVPRFGSYKYSAEKLYYKGVIVSVEGYPPRQLDKISLTISSDEAGVFDVQVSLMGVRMPGGGCEIRMQDLLQLQYDNVQTMTLYEGSVVVNTNLLVFLINKKFYA